MYGEPLLANAVIIQAWRDANAKEPDFNRTIKTPQDEATLKFVISEWERNKEDSKNFLCGVSLSDRRDLGFWCKMSGREDHKRLMSFCRKHFKMEGK